MLFCFLIEIVKSRYRSGLFDRSSLSSSAGNSDANSLRNKFSAKSPCGNGLRFHNGLCMDIDECILDENACDSNQICVNDIGGYHCDCKIGFNLDATTNACIGNYL